MCFIRRIPVKLLDMSSVGARRSSGSEVAARPSSVDSASGRDAGRDAQTLGAIDDMSKIVRLYRSAIVVIENKTTPAERAAIARQLNAESADPAELFALLFLQREPTSVGSRGSRDSERLPLERKGSR